MEREEEEGGKVRWVGREMICEGGRGEEEEGG